MDKGSLASNQIRQPGLSPAVSENSDLACKISLSFNQEGAIENYLEDLIWQAHALYGKTSIFEVMDVDRNAAIERMIEIYGPADLERIERYFAVLDRIRAWREPATL